MSATATEQAANRAAAAAARGAAMQTNSFSRMNAARERLGIRSEHTIQREIQRTQAAYARLATDGSRSWREQVRSADAMRQKVTELTNEMGKLTKRQKVIGALKGGMAVGAGAAAAGYVVKDPIQRAIDFDFKLAGMANNAFADRDLAGRKTGKKELEELINRSTKTGGGTREATAEALNSLLAANAMSYEDMKKVLPELAKASTASGASMVDLAAIANTAIQNFGIKSDEVANILNMAVAAGQTGKFELNNMAQHLPLMLAAGKGSGMRGRADFAGIVSLAQAAALTAGSNDQAGTNMTNLLNALSSKETARKIKKKTGVSLSKHLQESREKGINSIDAFAELVTRSVSNRKDYKLLQEKINATDNDEERQTVLAQMSDIAMGAGLGDIISEKRALMALFAMVNNKGFMGDVKKQVLANDVSGGGAVDQNFALMSSTTGLKMRQAGEAKDMAQKEALDSLTPAIGIAADAFTSLTEGHGALVGATTLATSALTAFAGAAGLATLATGGSLGKVAGAAGGIVRGVAGRGMGAAGAILATRGMSVGAGLASAGMSTAAAGLLASGAAGYAVGSAANWGINKGVSALAGRDASLGTLLYDWFHGDEDNALTEISKTIKPPEQKPVDVNTNMTIMLGNGLRVQNMSTQVTGATAKVDTGNIMSGAP